MNTKKKTQILYVYKWATMGGVERVLLNRAHAFKSANVPVMQDVYFLYDSGGKQSLRQYINNHQLQNYLNVVDEFMPYAYDYILPIDTPEIFDMTKRHENIYFECHTAYKENRTYLSKLPTSIKGVVVPSNHFKEDVFDEIPFYHQENIFTLRNCVPDESVQYDVDIPTVYNKIPIVYIGRVDKLKNTTEIVRIFKRLVERVGDDFLLIIAGPITPEINLFEMIKSENVINRWIYLPPVSFDKVKQLLNITKKHGGIFISASKGESFGLSVAEAIVSEIPIVLSEPHRRLINDESSFLYPLGDIDKAVDIIEFIINNSEEVKLKVQNLKEQFSITHFINDWNKLF